MVARNPYELPKPLDRLLDRKTRTGLALFRDPENRENFLWIIKILEGYSTMALGRTPDSKLINSLYTDIGRRLRNLELQEEKGNWYDDDGFLEDLKPIWEKGRTSLSGKVSAIDAFMSSVHGTGSLLTDMVDWNEETYTEEELDSLRRKYPIYFEIFYGEGAQSRTPIVNNILINTTFPILEWLSKYKGTSSNRGMEDIQEMREIRTPRSVQLRSQISSPPQGEVTYLENPSE